MSIFSLRFSTETFILPTNCKFDQTPSRYNRRKWNCRRSVYIIVLSLLHQKEIFIQYPTIAVYCTGTYTFLLQRFDVNFRAHVQSRVYTYIKQNEKNGGKQEKKQENKTEKRRNWEIDVAIAYAQCFPVNLYKHKRAVPFIRSLSQGSFSLFFLSIRKRTSRELRFCSIFPSPQMNT